MPAAMAAIPLILGAYLLGAIPFGYLVGRMRGVNLLTVGSGNIGATNAGRVLGRPFGILVFVLDFAKGAIPVVVAPSVMRAILDDPSSAGIHPEWYRVLSGASAFLGHLFPAFLGFRGGKGVATGIGVTFMLAPIPGLAALVTWILIVLVSRYVSLGSLIGVVAMVIARLLSVDQPLAEANLPVTAFCLFGAAVVAIKHRSNVGRLLAGTENQVGDGTMRRTLVKSLHLLAVGFWFGGAGFFNFVAAPAIFESFKQVVDRGPSDRTAGVRIIAEDAPPAEKAALASALAGSAVGPIFPKYFAMQTGCAIVALVTALTWWSAPWGRARVIILGIATALVIVGWPISDTVSRLRLERFDPNPTTAAAAKEAFGPWHLVSLGLSALSTLLAGAGMAMAASLPTSRTETLPTK